MTIAGITTLSGTLTVEGHAHLKSGVEIDGPYTVSGLTNKGTLFTNANEGSQNIINFGLTKTINNVEQVVDKGSLHIDGLENAILDLKDNTSVSWAKFTPSGTFIDTEDFAVGTTVHPDTVLFGTTLTTQGLGPAIILRNEAGLTNAQIAEPVGSSNQDWFVGTGTNRVN